MLINDHSTVLITENIKLSWFVQSKVDLSESVYDIQIFSTVSHLCTINKTIKVNYIS